MCFRYAFALGCATGYGLLSIGFNAVQFGAEVCSYSPLAADVVRSWGSFKCECEETRGAEREREMERAGERASGRKQGVPGAGGVCVIYLICVFIFGLVFSSVLRCDVSGDRLSLRLQVHSVQFNSIFLINHLALLTLQRETLLSLFLLMFKCVACNQLS